MIALLSSLLLLAASPAATATPAEASAKKTETATFAGGCFWCVEADFDKVKGVLSTTSGYTGGWKKDPTYKEVSYNDTGHTEAVQIVYDPSVVTYAELVEHFWRTIDPTVENRQFCDVGSQYRSEIFVHDAEQRRIAEASKKKLSETKPFKAPIVTPITDAAVFYPAEDYHQDYYRKNPLRYRYYRNGCGRDQRLKQLWGAENASAR